MIDTGLEKFGAAGPALGYIYQIRTALLWSLQALKVTAFVVSIERLDDVAFSVDGDPVSILQTKHSVKHAANLSDSSPDIWKTLRIWIAGQSTGTIPLQAARFLISTSSIPEGGACTRLGLADRNPELASDLLSATASTSSNDALQDVFVAFLALSRQERIRLLSTVYVLGNQPNVLDLESEIRNELFWMVLGEKRDKAISRLEGWWFRRVIRALGAPRSDIASGEIEVEINEIQEEFKREGLPIDPEFAELTVALEQLPEFSSKVFYKQLELVGAGTDRIRHAVVSYLRAFGQRSYWIRDQLLFIGEVDKYETRLSEEWSLRFAQICDGLGKPAAEDQMKAAGKAILQWAEDINIPIRPNVSAPWISRGSLQMLADEKRVGWHPEFRSRLAALLGAVEPAK